jgi:hypothetical protein
MYKKLDSGCSQLYRYILVFFNVIIFIMGLLICILAAVLKWGKLGDFSEIDKLGGGEILGLAKINTITILILVVGVFALLLSLVGLLGLCYLNKFFLYVYEIVVLLLFLVHGIGLLVALFAKDSIVDLFNKELTSIVDKYTNATTTKDVYCDEMKTLAELFKCCGSQSPSTLKNQTNIDTCCAQSDKSIVFSVTDTSPKYGCVNNVADKLIDNAKSYILIPSGVILVVELIVIVVTPLMIGDIRKIADSGY